MRIPEHIIDQIKATVNIVDVVSEFVQLQKRGQNFVGLCPFHKENTPSFSVSLERGMYKCFGCGKGGNVFSFVQEMKHLDFPSAVRDIAKNFHIPIPEETVADPSGEIARSESAFRALHTAMTFYQNFLLSESGLQFKTYLINRSITEDSVQKFSIGAAPDEWNSLLRDLTDKGFSKNHLLDAGLIVVKDGGGAYDRFRSRVMFPVKDSYSRVVGFSARTLSTDKTQAKYINSPQSLVYNKSKVLFGLDIAKRAIAENRNALIVEGQVDVVMMHQVGFHNTVGTSGTALSENHIGLLRKHADKITLIFDADDAGQNAMTKAIEVCLAGGFEVYCVKLPSGSDPDSLIRNGGLQTLKDLVAKAMSWIRYRTSQLIDQGKLNDSHDKSKALHTMLDWIATSPDKLRHPFLLTELAQTFEIDVALLQSHFYPYHPNLREKKSMLGERWLHPEDIAPLSPPPPVILPAEALLLRIGIIVEHSLEMLLHQFRIDKHNLWSIAGQNIFDSLNRASDEQHDITSYMLHDSELSQVEREVVTNLSKPFEKVSPMWESHFDVEMPVLDYVRPCREALTRIDLRRIEFEKSQARFQIRDAVDYDEQRRSLIEYNQHDQRHADFLNAYHNYATSKLWLPAGTQSES